MRHPSKVAKGCQYGLQLYSSSSSSSPSSSASLSHWKRKELVRN
jgi:hypothetical protein